MQQSAHHNPGRHLPGDTFYFLICACLTVMSIVLLLYREGNPDCGLLILLFSIGMAIFHPRILLAEREVKRAAARTGVCVECIVHAPAVFDPRREFDADRAGSNHYAKRPKIFYSIRHRMKKNSTWAPLMPEKASPSQYPNGWRRIVPQGRVPGEPEELIRQYSEDPIWRRHPVWPEIQSFPERIGVFWDESSIAVAVRLREWLDGLSEKTE
jgi:hypothetical protein